MNETNFFNTEFFIETFIEPNVEQKWKASFKELGYLTNKERDAVLSDIKIYIRGRIYKIEKWFQISPTYFVKTNKEEFIKFANFYSELRKLWGQEKLRDSGTDWAWGELGEHLDNVMVLHVLKTDPAGWQFLSKESKETYKGMDFLSMWGLEDTKLQLNKESFAVEITGKHGNLAHHWVHFKKNKDIYLRFINNDGCFRIKLTEEILKMPNVKTTHGTNCVFLKPDNELFEKVWSW